MEAAKLELSGSGRHQSMWLIILNRFLKHKMAMLGLAVLVIIHLTAAAGPYLVERDLAYRPQPIKLLTAPNAENILGTDEVGRDIMARVVYGGRISLTVGILAMAMAVGLGTALGAAAGFYGGWVDAAIMRINEVLLSIPRLFLLIVLAAFLGPSIKTLILVIGGLSWMESCRVVRASFLTLREKEFVLAARAVGVRDYQIIFRHILPNALAPIVVGATLGVGNALLLEATISYLGLGVQPPEPSWGNMLNKAQTYLLEAPHAAIFPGLMILITVLSVNFVGDGLRDALDPRLKGAR